MCEYEVLFNPLLLGFPLSFVAGRSYVFAPVAYFASATCCVIFNVFKMHRHCIEHMASRLLLESLWAMILFMLYVNIMVTDPANMLYLLQVHGSP